MVKPLAEPERPLPSGGATVGWRWRTPTATAPWGWCRIYHRSGHTATGADARRYGPLFRFDPHTPPPELPALDPGGRTVLYVGRDLATSACEVFGEAGEARLCPNYRVTLLRPTSQLTVFDLTAEGSALAIGALPSLGDGPCARPLTQAWARAIYEDNPTISHVDGIRYRSAYNYGISLALWDTKNRVEVVRDNSGRAQDYALRSPAMYARLVDAMKPRHIVVTLLDRTDCPSCA